MILRSQAGPEVTSSEDTLTSLYLGTYHSIEFPSPGQG